MNRSILPGPAAMAVFALSSCATTPGIPRSPELAKLDLEAATNPALAPWQGPYDGIPPWDVLSPDVFPKAFDLGIKMFEREIDGIASQSVDPTFENTIFALEDSGRHLSRAETLFGVMTGNMNSPAIQAIEREWSPKLAAAYDRVFFDARLFGRVRTLFETRQSLGLTAEQLRLLERTYQEFLRSGAKLDDAQKKKLGDINQALAVAFTDFGNKVLADENTWVVLEGPADLEGLPESLVSAYKAAATERNLPDKWVVVNTRSSVDPFLASSRRRDLREKVWKAFKNRGANDNANNTAATIAQIVRLRSERAQLLGFASHAHWRMSDTMALDPKNAQALMMKVWPAAVARVREEVQDMTALAGSMGDKITIEPWDYLYYAEKVRKAKYDLDQNELKPYFQLDNMIQAAFFMAEQLYGLSFIEITGKVPVFHPDVRVFEVRTRGSDEYLGLFYGDYFARPEKRSGAWASTYRRHETIRGKVKPITSNNNNFVRGAKGEAVLISLDDAETLFHEFGHALHSLLSQVNYPGLSTTPRDFVEYPSQVHEQWVLTRPVLDRFAKHFKTGEPMPQALVAKVEASSKFNQGYGTVEYLASAIVDMELHIRPEGEVDPVAFERDTLARIGAPKEVAMRHRLPQFNHLFTSDAYSAGYYSYLWSEVMDADTRKAFAEVGNVFDPGLAEKLQKYILAPGNSTDRAEAYRQFRGRDPDVGALLEKRGFPVN